MLPTYSVNQEMLIYHISTTITILPVYQLKLRALSSPTVRASRAIWKPVACLKAFATLLHKWVFLPLPQAKPLILWQAADIILLPTGTEAAYVRIVT